METINDKKPVAKNPAERPVHLVRRGAIAASIWRRQTQTGFAYYEFTLSRSWKTKNGASEGYSKSFFSRNAGELVEVIDGATKWIAEKEQSALGEDADQRLQQAAA